MDTIVTVPLNDYKSWRISDYLFVAAGCSLIVWYIQWLWSRRKLYKYASQVHGPTGLPILGNAYQFIGTPYKIYKNIIYIFETYPPLCKIWYGPRLFYGVQAAEHLDLLLNSPKALEKEMLYKYAEPVVGLGLFTAPVSSWKKHRKIISPTFNQRILDQFVEVFAEQGEILTDQMKNHCGKQCDIFHLITKATLDIICETAMGVKVHAQTTDSLFGKWTDRVMEIVFMRMFVIIYHIDFIFNLTPLSKEFNTIIQKMHDFTGKVVVEKRKAYEKKMQMRKSFPEAEIEETTITRKAFLDYLIELTYTGEENMMTDEEIRQEVDTFMIAGSDTTASSNCFIFLALGIHPHIQEKVYEEVLEVLGPDKKVEYADLPKLKYLECVIKETLRLFPVGAFIVRAVVEDLDLGDATLPAGCSAVLGILSAHRNKKYWKDPLKFNPDRFLPGNVEKIVPGSYLPFSWGPRNCIGPKYAMMAMKSLVAVVIRKYKMHTVYKSVEEVELKTNLVLRPKDGFKVTFEERF